jgi:hypothetical protein
MSRSITPLSAALFGSAVLIALAGCGGMHHSLAPDSRTTGAVAAVADPAPAAREAADAAGDGDDADASDSFEHATAITGATTITAGGDYRLVQDIDVTTGDAIVIRANNVRLSLGDHWLRGPGNKLGRAIVLDGCQQVSVRGGHVAHFGLGAALLGTSACAVRGLDVRGGDETADPANGNPPQIGIMLVNSAGNRIAQNGLNGVNLGIFVRGAGSHDNVIRFNHVMAGDHGLLGICYNPAPDGGPSGPQHDRVSRNVLQRFGTGISASAQSVMNTFARNEIAYFDGAYRDLNGTNVFANNSTQQLVR